MTAKYSYARLGTIEEDDFPSVSEAAKKAIYHYTDDEGMNSDCIPFWIDVGETRVWNSAGPNSFQRLESLAED